MKHTLRRMIPIVLFLASLCCFNTIGCASFPGKELPKYTYDQIIPVSPKPSIDYDATFYSLGNENAAGVKIFQEEINKVFRESNFFQKYNAGVGSEQYHFTMVLKNEGNVGLAALSGFISGLTLTVIPAYARDNYVLTIDVKKGGQLLKQYKYNHYMDTWIELFLVFLTPTHWPPKVVREVMDQMLLNFIHDLQGDAILAGQ